VIINHSFKFIFIKTRKTASTSIEIALSRFCRPGDIITPITADDEKIRASLGYAGPQNYNLSLRGPDLHPVPRQLFNHMSAKQVREIFPEIWQDYFKFCFERNPFDKAISRYFWERRKPLTPTSISDFLKSAPRWMLSNWDLYSDERGVIVDFVGKYETLEAELEFVKETLKLPDKVSLPAQKAKGGFRTDNRHYREVLTPADRHLIEQVCAKECHQFSYSW
jgi:hypothetical protein